MAESDEVETEREVVAVDYDALDAETGFKQVDWAIWTAMEEWKAKPEDDREPQADPNELDGRIEWAKWFAAEGPMKPGGDDAKAQQTFENRCVAVVRLGLYAGARDEFNQRNGKAKAIYSNGDIYEGHFYEGKKNGQGKYVSKSLGKSEVDKLIEDMVMALPEKERVYSKLNSCWTVPPEKHDAFVTQATQALCVGDVVVRTALEYGYHPFYHGDYQNGIRNGTGAMKGKDGSVYKGEWRDGKRHGQGLLYYVNGDTYSGNWDQGNRCGYGTYSFAHWSKNMVDGKPVYTCSPGGDYRGEWGEESYLEDVDGERVEKTAKGIIREGEWRMPDGTHFEGTFNRACQPHTQNPPPLVLQADGAPPEYPKTFIHFPRWGLAQSGVMKKGQWAPQFKLVAVEPPTETAY